jgi:hypothetical protein
VEIERRIKMGAVAGIAGSVIGGVLGGGGGGGKKGGDKGGGLPDPMQMLGKLINTIKGGGEG